MKAFLSEANKVLYMDVVHMLLGQGSAEGPVLSPHLLTEHSSIVQVPRGISPCHEAPCD